MGREQLLIIYSVLRWVFALDDGKRLEGPKHPAGTVQVFSTGGTAERASAD